MTRTAKLKRKLEDEANIVFKKDDDYWIALMTSETSAIQVAKHKYLGDCVSIAAKEVGEA